MNATTIGTTTGTIDHKAELRDWLESVSSDYFGYDESVQKMVNGICYRATERALSPQQTKTGTLDQYLAKIEKANNRSTETKAKRLRKNTEYKAAGKVESWTVRGQKKGSRHVPAHSISEDARYIQSEIWSYLAEFVSLVEFSFEDMGERFGPPSIVFNLEWKRSNRSTKVLRRSGNLANLHKILLWTAASAAINEKKHNDKRRSEVLSINQQESIELVSSQIVSLDFSSIVDDVFPLEKVRPLTQSGKDVRLAVLANKKIEQKRDSLRTLLDIIEQKRLSGEPLTSSERVKLFRLREHIPQQDLERAIRSVSNVPCGDVGFRAVPIVDDIDQYNLWLLDRSPMNYERTLETPTGKTGNIPYIVEDRIVFIRINSWVR